MSDGPRQPRVTGRDRGLEQAVARGRDADHALAAVSRVRRRTNQPGALERRERLRDGLVGDVLGGGERGRGAGPVVAEPLDHGHLRDRQLDLASPGGLAQPPAQALDRHRKPNGQRVGAGESSRGRAHVTSMIYTSDLRK